MELLIVDLLECTKVCGKVVYAALRAAESEKFGSCLVTNACFCVIFESLHENNIIVTIVVTIILFRNFAVTQMVATNLFQKF